MPELEENRLYSLDEVARITGLSARNLRTWAASGDVAALKRGRQWYLNAAQIRYLIGQGSNPDDTLKDIDLTDIECRLTDLLQKLTGKELENDDRDELLDILETFMRAALTGKTEIPSTLDPED